MIPLLRHLSSAFNCPIEELPTLIRENRMKVTSIVETLQIYVQVGNTRHVVKCDGVTERGPRALFATGGELQITVEQYLYVTKRILLNFPQMPCIIQRIGEFGGETYVPMELVLVDPKQK